MMIEGNDTNTINHDFLLAVSNGELAEAARLRQEGADINVKFNGIPAIFYAKRYPEMICWMIQSGADVHAVDCLGQNLLMFLVVHCEDDQDSDYRAVFNAVLAAGVDPNAGDGYQPILYYAVSKGSYFDVEALVMAGANFEVVKSDGTSALMIAAQWGYRSIVKRLLELGANPNSCDRIQITALHSACKHKGNIEVMELLIKAGADINAKDFFGYTPLIWVIENGDQVAADFLIASGATGYQ